MKCILGQGDLGAWICSWMCPSQCYATCAMVSLQKIHHLDASFEVPNWWSADWRNSANAPVSLILWKCITRPPKSDASTAVYHFNFSLWCVWHIDIQLSWFVAPHFDGRHPFKGNKGHIGSIPRCFNMYPPPKKKKVNMSPEKAPFWKKKSSSNHQFSEDRLVFRGVYNWYV